MVATIITTLLSTSNTQRIESVEQQREAIVAILNNAFGGRITTTTLANLCPDGFASVAIDNWEKENIRLWKRARKVMPRNENKSFK